MARVPTIAFVAASLLWAGAARAGEVFAGVYAHDVDDGISYGKFEKGAQIVVGARTTALDELSFLGKPRVHLLVGVNTAGGTNYAATGLSWRFHFDERFYIQPGIGIAIQDGRVNLPSPDAPGITPEERLKRIRDFQTKLDLGSRVLFEPELSIGWKATPRLSMELSWIHMSHARLAGDYNPGVGDVGVRVLYRYGLDR
ncbi:MAG: acyloxyacyl hydrolase [Alphaproteobacteria bacterium]|nr:acyloxyacyl hydrolase [Alphaproteobacteria bacterium]MBU1515589.1 acyloxyacyl hydrolase [Alphaproteobacteria bacterium]MBU2096924.1 acyloxyacyl hydrolase [Alphaproteobacteria bacterium]MBU2149579.1 acyloxyacyl hydrolase [Alphaproteobacteria bacterium]MBU2305685.1 acyloxyacyl hydrolase [Alphaproteobacteria bacterium]